MNKPIAILLLSSLGVSAQANSMALAPVETGKQDGEVSFAYSIRNIDDQLSNTFLSTEPIKLQFNINIKGDDIDQSGSLFLVANYKDKWYQKNAAGHWQAWDRQESSLLPFSHKTLEKQEIITVLNNETLAAGEYLVYGGYQSEKNKQIFYNNNPASLLLFDNDNSALHQVKNKPLLASYFARGIQNNRNYFASDFSPPSAVTANTEASSSVSQTNLQEIGVDEADRIKTDGEHLYALGNCDSGQNKQCISSYAIQSSPASNTQLGQLEVGNYASQNGGLYLSEFNNKKHIIHHNDSSNYGMFDIWFSPFYWQGNQTDIKIIDVSQPQAMEIGTHITMDTSILSSRLINGVLYLVTRKNSYFSIPEIELPFNDQPVTDPVVEVGTSFPGSPTVPENQTIDDLLPTISFNDGANIKPAVQATDCYIPSQNSVKPIDNTIITVTAIPLDNPGSHYSTCIAGAVDTFYMSANALYLATSRYPYSIEGNRISFAPFILSEQTEMATEIHKFSLAEGILDYRGSGSVQGHLGWDADKQPFRMGEYNNILKVATSKGNTWNDSSTTNVSVLHEASSSKRLEQMGLIENLGKPGERLFAARFIKDRGYLVTFKQTDPLYVLDFTQPEQPTVIGELEINGYSDYLHPIGDNYLLGIGKDAIPNDNPDLGAFFQGVKLSLFDVSSAENLQELDSVILGKRGTESAVLQDHHALAWLPSTQDDSAILAIPVQLNVHQGNNIGQDYSHPSAYYDWTHTGLYTFNITTGANPSIELQGKLITDIPPEQCNEPGNYCSFKGQNTQNDRAVIQEDTIHYIHNNAVFSSTIADLK